MKLLTPAKKQAQGKTRRLQCQMVKRRMAMAVREETAEHRLQSLTVKRRTAMVVRVETAERRLKCRTVRRLTAAAALVTWAAVPADRRVSPTRRQTK